MFSDFYCNINLSSNQNIQQISNNNDNNNNSNNTSITVSNLTTKPQTPIKRRRPKKPKNPEIKSYLHHFFTDSYFKKKQIMDNIKKPNITGVVEVQNKTNNVSTITDSIFNKNNNKPKKKEEPPLFSNYQTQTNHLINDNSDLSNNISNDSSKSILNNNHPPINLNTSNTSFIQINHIYPPFEYQHSSYLESNHQNDLYYNPNYSYNYYHLKTNLLNNQQSAFEIINNPLILNDSTDQKTSDLSFNNDNGLTDNFDDELKSLLINVHSNFLNDDND